jgi:thiol-disulfide isomerase/thioredoxin
MTKKIIFPVLLLAICGLAVGQSPYISTPDPQHPDQHILNGIITKYALENDATYGWYNSSGQNYKPSDAVLNTMKEAAGKVKFVVFGGTWCEDTQFVLPKFFKLQELSGYPDAGISFFATDRNKKTVGGIADAFKIINVPTIIVMKDGIEVGRVVEYGKTGQWDKELAELIK